MKSQSFKTFKKFSSRFCINRRGRLRRLLLTALVTSSSLMAAASSGIAEERPQAYRGGISILVHEFHPENATSVLSASTQELAPTATPLRRTSSQFSQSIAAAVGASAARIGIPVEQFLEPFATIGRIGGSSPETSPYPSRATESAALTTTLPDKTPAVETDDELAAAVSTRQQEFDDIFALDCWWLGDDVGEWVAEENGDEDVFLTEAAVADAAGANEFENSDRPCVGSAPIIVTIPDAYFPYDFARRDLELEFLPLTTIQPIRKKNYVSLPDPPNIDDAVELAATEPVVTGSPECMLDELLHSVTAFTDQNHLRDLTFAKLGESAGNLFASTLSLPLSTDGSARRELSLSTDGSARRELPLSTDGSARRELSLSTDGSARREHSPSSGHTAPDELVLSPTEVSPVRIIDDRNEAPADAEVVGADTESPLAEEVIIAEIVMMEVDGEQIPAPIADEVPNAVKPDNLVCEEFEESPASVEIAVANIVIISDHDEVTIAPIVDEASNADRDEQFVVNTVVAQEATEMATDELIQTAPVDTFSLSQVMSSIHQWQQQAMEIIFNARDLSSLPSTEVAEKPDSSNENVIR